MYLLKTHNLEHVLKCAGNMVLKSWPELKCLLYDSLQVDAVKKVGIKSSEMFLFLMHNHSFWCVVNLFPLIVHMIITKCLAISFYNFRCTLFYRNILMMAQTSLQPGSVRN